MTPFHVRPGAHPRRRYPYFREQPFVMEVPPPQLRIVHDGSPHFCYRQDNIPDGGDDGPCRVHFPVLRPVSVPPRTNPKRRSRRAPHALSQCGTSICFSPQHISISLCSYTRTACANTKNLSNRDGYPRVSMLRSFIVSRLNNGP